MKRRTLLAGLASTAAAGSLATLAGCGGQPQTSGTEGSVEKAELTYTCWDTATPQLLKQQLPKFNEKFPGITVKVTMTPWKDYWTKLQTQASSGTAPDVFAMNGTHFELYASNGLMDPIDDLVADKSIDPANYPKALVEQFTYEDKHYGVPGDFDSVALWYNKAIFDQAGEKYPTAEWTWDDVNAVAATISKKLKSKGIYGFSPSIADSQITYYNTIPSAGGYVINEDRTKSGYDQPEAIAGIKFFADMMNNGTSPTINQLTDQAGDVWFGNAKSAMFFAASYNVEALAQSDHAADFQLVPLPKKQSSTSVVAGNFQAVSAGGKNKAAARELVKWMAGEDYAKSLAALGSIIPAFNGSQDAYLATHKEWDLQVYVDAAATGVLYPTSKNTDSWASLEPKILADCWAGKATPEATGAELAKQMNEQLQKA